MVMYNRLHMFVNMIFVHQGCLREIVLFILIFESNELDLYEIKY